MAVGRIKFRRFAMPATGAIAGVSLTPIDPSEVEDRPGYDPGFLGDGARVPLPKLSEAQRKDAVKITGSSRIELKYQHFSVVQSRKRRLCYFSATNLDGQTSKKVKRSNMWRQDGRRPRSSRSVTGGRTRICSAGDT
jgi:endonuclease G